MLTDGAATNANTTTPVFVSASYSFVAGDVGACVFIASGSNWKPGFYRITGTNSGAAILNATSGQWLSYTASPQSMVISTTTGAATTASPTGATWSIDYSQQNGAQFTYTDLTDLATGTSMTSAGNPFGKQQVGNSVVINNQGTGNLFVLGRFTLISVSGVTGTFDRNVSTGAGANGGGGMGGALATLNQAAVVMIGSNRMWVQYNASAFPFASNWTWNPSGVSPGGTVTYTRISGYNTYRGDNPTGSSRPVVQSTGTATAMINPSIAGGNLFENLIIDCNNVASSEGIKLGTTNSNSIIRNIQVKNFKVYGIHLNSGTQNSVENCEVNGGASGSTNGINLGTSNFLLNCYVHDCQCTGISVGTACSVVRCLVYNCTGASSDGIAVASSTLNAIILNCDVYGCGRDGIRFINSSNNTTANQVHNNILVSNTGNGMTFTTATYPDPSFDGNAYYNNAATRSGCGTGVQDVILTGNPFNSAGTDFGLNATAGAGAACRGAAINPNPPGLTGTTSGLDMGAVQHSSGGANVGVAQQPTLTGGING
jgi:hypothetical protein